MNYLWHLSPSPKKDRDGINFSQPFVRMQIIACLVLFRMIINFFSFFFLVFEKHAGHEEDSFFYLIINIFLISRERIFYLLSPLYTFICIFFCGNIKLRLINRSLTVKIFCKTWNIWCCQLIYLIFINNSFSALIMINLFIHVWNNMENETKITF